MESLEVLESSPADTLSQNGQTQESQQFEESTPAAQDLQKKRKEKSRSRRNMQWQQSSYVTRSPQETKYKYVGIRLLLTMTKVLAKCAHYLMIGYNVGMMI